MVFKVTDFPAPEPPMMESVWPSSTVSENPLRICFPPNDLWRSLISITNGVPSQQCRRPERVEHQDDHAADHDRARGGVAHALGAAGRVEAVEAADPGHHQPEAARLDQRE